MSEEEEGRIDTPEDAAPQSEPKSLPRDHVRIEMDTSAQGIRRFFIGRRRGWPR